MSESYKWWGVSVVGRLNGDEVVQMWRLGSSEDFVRKWKEFVSNAFSYLEPVDTAVRLLFVCLSVCHKLVLCQVTLRGPWNSYEVNFIGCTFDGKKK